MLASTHSFTKMASLLWSFGPDGFMLRVNNEEGATSVVQGAVPMDEMNITLTPLTNDPATHITTEVIPPVTHNDWGPLTPQRSRMVTLRTPVQVAVTGAGSQCETSLQATWVMKTNSISGKGSGKGLGKSNTVEPVLD